MIIPSTCFVDFRKCFDTVWTDGLLYKMLHYYNISPKFTRLTQNMYSKLRARVNYNGSLTDYFRITIGTRQGCNLSPQFFNLYTNDLPLLLQKSFCDPVSLGNKNINVLLYADDMLILSRSEWGLRRSLKVLEAYCKQRGLPA